MAKKRAGRETRHRGIKDLGNGVYLVRAYGIDPVTRREVERERRVPAKSITEALTVKLRLEEEILGRQTPATTGTRNSALEPVERLTLGDAAKAWVERVTSAKRKDGTLRLAPTTRDRYRHVMKTMILPFLAREDVRELTRPKLERWRDALAESFASSTVNAALSVLRTMLRSMEVTAADKVAALVVDDTRITDDEPNSLDEAELGAFLGAMGRFHPQHVPMTLVLLTTGARISTVLALEWTDIDAQKGVVTFRRRRSGEEILPGVKRSRTARDVAPLHPEVWAALEEHRDGLNDLQRATGLVFPSTEGGYHARSVLDRAFRDSRKVAGIAKRFTPHGCRRTASALYRKAAGSVVAMAIVGHTTEEMHRHYSGPDAAEKQAASRAAFRVLDGGRTASERKTGDQTGEQRDIGEEAVAK